VHIPAPLRVLSVAPGKTLAAILCARYSTRSTLSYHELAVAPALTHSGSQAGFWISHIYVDSPVSLAGGREIWALPKQLARFEWREGAVEVFDGPIRLCGIRWTPRRFRIPAPLVVPVFSRRELQLRRFWLRGWVAAAPCRGSIRIDRDAPFSSLGFESAKTLIQVNFRARIGAPAPAR
jgi:hypothetical protein